MGVQYCEDGVWGECMCNGSGTDGDGTTGELPTGESSDGGDEGSTGEPAPTEVCFPGADEAYTTCFPLHPFDPDAPPAGYAYPEPLGGDPNYRQPIAFIDLEEIDGATYLAPNFRLDEIAQAFKGQWAIVQPHAVESLQALRDEAGVLNVNSGYRSPAYNLDIGGATYSRHMYGDGFDLDPTGVSVDLLEGMCEDHGGMLVEYETHVHCDWRFDDVDVEFFGPPAAAAPAAPAFAARVESDGDELSAPAEGFDEGEPLRRWIALDDQGEVLARKVGRTFTPPEGTARVDVVVGARVEISFAPGSAR
ncbi:MAG TPA: D-Ala-D-Ala carboxypeptidase family metallohydrolase, partial [Nannocystaceae bacterium]|nr:D-Ala-D-Ala carboxypeptidase family metallohydrolase [Nannocystaceae bacterium]